MEFSRKEYWSGLPCCSPGDLPNTGLEPRCPALQADSLLSEPPGKSNKYCNNHQMLQMYVPVPMMVPGVRGERGDSSTWVGH